MPVSSHFKTAPHLARTANHHSHLEAAPIRARLVLCVVHRSAACVPHSPHTPQREPQHEVTELPHAAGGAVRRIAASCDSSGGRFAARCVPHAVARGRCDRQRAGAGRQAGVPARGSSRCAAACIAGPRRAGQVPVWRPPTRCRALCAAAHECMRAPPQAPSRRACLWILRTRPPTLGSCASRRRARTATCCS
jgi:hypothetical protein